MPPAERKRTPKTESLTIRLDPKTRFILEFVARLRGQTITTVVERAILEVADRQYVPDTHQTWRDYWDASDGVRALALAAEPLTYPSHDDEMRLAFAKEHWPFFFTSKSCETPRRVFVDILWPRIDEFRELHASGKSSNYWGAGNEMQAVLSAANVKPPEWPIGTPPTRIPADTYIEMDNDIPF